MPTLRLHLPATGRAGRRTTSLREEKPQARGDDGLSRRTP